MSASTWISRLPTTLFPGQARAAIRGLASLRRDRSLPGPAARARARYAGLRTIMNHIGIAARHVLDKNLYRAGQHLAGRTA